MAKAMITWPKMGMTTVSTLPSLGNSTTLPVRNTVPITPPIHTHHGSAAAAAKSQWKPVVATARDTAQRNAMLNE